MKIIKRIGLFCLYISIVLTTIFSAISEEIPYVQLEDTSGISYLNIFNYNTSVHNNLTGLQGGLAPNQYYHLNYADYIAVQTALGNISFSLSDFDLQEGYIYVGNSSNNPEEKLSLDFISEFNFGNWTDDKINYLTTVEIIAFGYYNGSDFIITDYFTKDEILGFNYYNLSDFDIADYFTSAEVLAFSYYNLSDFDIADYFTSAEVLGFNYYNSSDFVITDYYTKIEVNDIVEDANNSIKDYIDELLITTYYNATSVKAVRGTASGVIGNIQIYDNIPYNVTEVAGANGLDFRINFTGITSFNQIKVRYKSIAGESHIMYLQIYDTILSNWENYYVYNVVPDYINLPFAVDDSTDHIIDGVVQVRFYQPANGNTGHTHYFDWVIIADGYATPSGTEIDPYSWHRNSSGETGTFITTGNVTAGYFKGDGSELTGITDENTNCSVAGTCSPIVYNTNTSWITSNQLFNTTNEIFNAVDNGTFYLLSNPYNFYNDSDFDILDYVTSAVLLSYGYYNESDFVISDYPTTAQADLLYAPINYGDEFNKTYTDTLYSPINYNPFNQSLNTTDDVQFNDVTLNSIIFDENKSITFNNTCMIFKVEETYIDLCR